MLFSYGKYVDMHFVCGFATVMPPVHMKSVGNDILGDESLSRRVFTPVQQYLRQNGSCPCANGHVESQVQQNVDEEQNIINAAQRSRHICLYTESFCRLCSARESSRRVLQTEVLHQWHIQHSQHL
jgi:hypothetical protein